MNKKILQILAVLLALIGLIWFGQGIGLIHGSVMTDDSKWVVIGGIMVIAGLALFWYARGRAR